MPLIVVLIFMSIGFWTLLNCLEWRLRAQRVAATLIGVREAGKDRENGEQMYSAVYQYIDAFGRSIEVTAGGSQGGLRGLRTGKSVTLLVAADDPNNVREAYSFMLEFIGAAFFGVGFWQLTLVRPDWPLSIHGFTLVGLALAYFVGKRFARPRKLSSVAGAGVLTAPLMCAEELRATPAFAREAWKERLWSPVIILLGVAFIGGACYMGRDMLRLERTGLRAPGTVVAFNERSAKGGSVYHAVISFTPEAGRSSIQFEDGTGTTPPSYRVGDPVRVLYSGESAASAIIDKGIWNWLMPLVFGATGALCVTGGFAMLLQRTPRQDGLGQAAVSPSSTVGRTPIGARSVNPLASDATGGLKSAQTGAPPVVGSSSILETLVAYRHFKRWVLTLFVVDAVLTFGPPTTKTGYAAFGMILFAIVCVLAALSAVIAIVAYLIFTIFGLADTARVPRDALTSDLEAPKTHPLVGGHLRVQRTLWKGALGLMFGGIALLSVGFITWVMSGAPSRPADFSPLNTGKLTVWFACDQNISAQRENLLTFLHRDFPNLQINERTIPPVSLSAEWQAASGDTEPDLAFSDNPVTFRELGDKNAIWLNSSARNQYLNGSWAISKRSRHVEAARALFRWLGISPHWQPRSVVNNRLSTQETAKIETQALAAESEALRSGNLSGFERMLDSDAARAAVDPSYIGLKGLQVLSAKALHSFGNSRLAITTIAIEVTSEQRYGVTYTSIMFRKRGDEWRIFHVDRDITLRDAEIRIHSFDQKMTSISPPPPLPAPVLVEPANNYTVPFPELAWTLPAGTNVSFLLETQSIVGEPQSLESIDTHNLTNSRLVFVTPVAEPPNYLVKSPLAFGVDTKSYRVRVWALDPTGQTSFTDWHTMSNEPRIGSINHQSSALPRVLAAAVRNLPNGAEASPPPQRTRLGQTQAMEREP